MLIGMVLCAGFYHVLNILEKKKTKKKSNPKPLCITVWSIIHILALVGHLFMLNSFEEWNKNQVEEYRNFNAIISKISLCLSVCGAVAAVGLLSSKEWARREMVRLQDIGLALVLFDVLATYQYYAPKYSINIEGSDWWIYIISVLFLVWCRSNMSSQDVIDYFSSAESSKMAFGNDDDVDDDDDDDDYEHDDDNDDYEKEYRRRYS